MTIEKLIDEIIAREGRTFTNRAADRGGPTKYGVTLQRLSHWRKVMTLTARDVEKLQEPEAREIYRAQFVTEPGFDLIGSDPLRLLVVDTGVNHGPSAAIAWFQAAHGELAVDGVSGPKTRAALAAVTGLEVGAVYRRFLGIRVRRYFKLLHDDTTGTQAQNANGWGDRVADFIDVAP